MQEIPLSPTLTVDQLFKQWPQTIPVFLRHRFGCIGCLMAPFDTLTDVARNYQVDMAELLAELMVASKSKEYHRGTEDTEKIK